MPFSPPLKFGIPPTVSFWLNLKKADSSWPSNLYALRLVINVSFSIINGVEFLKVCLAVIFLALVLWTYCVWSSSNTPLKSWCSALVASNVPPLALVAPEENPPLLLIGLLANLRPITSGVASIS